MKQTENRNVVAIAVAIGVIALDQVTKAWMQLHPDFYRTGAFFELFLTTNDGVAFGIPVKGIVFYLFLLVTIVLGIRYSQRYIHLNRTPTQIALGLIVGGGVGNIIDRIRFGSVIDFIKVGGWPLFNIADSAITTAVIIILLWHKTILISERK